MELTFDTDELGRLIATLADNQQSAIVTASNVPAAARDLVDAVESAHRSGTGECFWQEQGGDYHWLFRREEGHLIVVVLWSTGTITGWQHVFRSECDPDALLAQVRTLMPM